MTLLETQRAFAKLVPRLVDKIHELGYECTLGEVKRSDEQACINALGEDGRQRLVDRLATMVEFHALALSISNNGKGNGILLSVHRDQLAIDINLFKEGTYIADGGDPIWKQIGDWWEAQHPLARAGYKFKDSNHFSFTWQGRA